MAGEKLDIVSDPGLPKPQETDRLKRPFVGIKFVCCDVYTRVYVNQAGTAYEGRCPKCSKAVTIRIAPGGTDKRFFVAY